MGEWMKGKVRTLSLALPLYGEGVHPEERTLSLALPLYGEGVHPEGLLPIKGEMPKGQRGSVPLTSLLIIHNHTAVGRDSDGECLFLVYTLCCLRIIKI